MVRDDNKTDLRIRRTKKAIRDAFFILLEKENFESISVKNITDEAMISRNTFYLHYQDKYDLLNKICNGLTDKLFTDIAVKVLSMTNLHFDEESTARVILIAQEVIDQDRELYRILFNDPGTVVFGMKIEQTIRRALDLIKNQIDGLSELSLEYLVTGFKGLVYYWVNHDDNDPKTEAANFTHIHLSSILAILRKNEADAQYKVGGALEQE